MPETFFHLQLKTHQKMVRQKSQRQYLRPRRIARPVNVVVMPSNLERITPI